MVSTCISYFVFALFLINIAWIFKGYLSKISSVVSYIGWSAFIILECAVLYFFGAQYALDSVIFLQLIVFASDAFRGKLFKKPKKNFYSLTFWETYYFIAYNVFFKGFYFFYVIGSFPKRLSENMRPIGTIVIFVVIAIIVFTDNKMNKNKDRSGYSQKKNY